MNSKGMGRLVASGMIAVLAAACGDSGGGEGGSVKGTDLTVRGLVTAAGNGGSGTPLAGATVAITVDVDGNGRISNDERITVSADVDGRYEISAKAARGQSVVVSISEEGYAPSFRRIIAGPKSEAQVNASLVELDPLNCEGERCAVEGNKLSIKGLGGVTGSARVFNPVTETHHFPGAFDDVDGNLLISGVFSAVELQDASGNDVHELDEEVELRMQMPRDTWPVIVDMQPDTDRIDLPMYAFDEVKGTWIRHDKDGWLEDGEGNVIPESELESIRTGAYTGVLIATSPVNHFSYWNVDWPVESHGCVSGTIRTEDGELAEGATVTATGVTYSGTSAGLSTGDDGRFALDVMRSEGADDVDQDGTPGETHSVALRVVHGGKVYDAGVHDVPAEQGSTQDGNCGDVGVIILGPELELQAGLCTATGGVFDEAGAPLSDVYVYAWDDTVPQEVLFGLCGEAFENCSFGEMTGADGGYSITTAVMDSMTVWAMHQWESEIVSHLRWGMVTRQGCPDGATNLSLTDGWDITELTVSVSGNSIGWAPESKARQIYVTGADGEVKWIVMIESDSTPGFDGPVTYGTVPAGATALFPYDGSAPAPLASGDSVMVSSYYYGQTGIWTMAMGDTVVP